MVVYLPISVLKKWICNLLKNSYRNFYEDYTSVSISSELSVALGINETCQGPETDLESPLITYKELGTRENGTPHEPNLLTQTDEHSLWKIAKCGLYLTPTWFASEVTGFL